MDILSDIAIWAENLFRWFYWTIISVEGSLVNTLLVSLEKGVLTAGITDNTWVQSAVTASITLMFIILPVKLAWEVVFSLIRDEEIDIGKKLFGAITGVMIAVSITTLVALSNNLMMGTGNQKGVMGLLLSGETETTTSTTSRNLLVSVFSSFGGMEETDQTFKDKSDSGNGVDIGATGLVDLMLGDDAKFRSLGKDPGYNSSENAMATFENKNFKNVRWNLYYRWDDTDEMTSDDSDLWDGENNVSNPISSDVATKRQEFIKVHDEDYVWDFNYFMVIIGLALFAILLFIITIEVATRLIQIAFFMIIGPLCCMSLTNYQNPQAFTVWKNSILGAYLVNFAQIFMLVFLCNIAGTISSIAIANNAMAQAIAKIALYFGAFSACLSMPSYIQSMLGGYGAGMLENMQQMKGAMAGVWGATGGMALGAGAKLTSAGQKLYGRHSEFTGHRTGGAINRVLGNKNSNGERVGGAVGTAKNLKNKADNLFNNGASGETDGKTDNPNAPINDNTTNTGNERANFDTNAGSDSSGGNSSRRSASSGTTGNERANFDTNAGSDSSGGNSSRRSASSGTTGNERANFDTNAGSDSSGGNSSRRSASNGTTSNNQGRKSNSYNDNASRSNNQSTNKSKIQRDWEYYYGQGEYSNRYDYKNRFDDDKNKE